MTWRNSRSYTSVRPGSNTSASRSTTIESIARPSSSATPRSSNSGVQGSPRWQISSSSLQLLANVLTHKQLQLLARALGNHCAIRDESVRQRRAAFAIELIWHRADGGLHQLGSVGSVLRQIGDYVVDRNGIVFGMPAVVVGHHRNGRVTHLSFAGELGFLQIRHADDVHTPASIQIGR